MPIIRSVLKSCQFCCCFSKVVKTENVERPSEIKDVEGGNRRMYGTCGIKLVVNHHNDDDGNNLNYLLFNENNKVSAQEFLTPEKSYWKKCCVPGRNGAFMLQNGEEYASFSTNLVAIDNDSINRADSIDNDQVSEMIDNTICSDDNTIGNCNPKADERIFFLSQERVNDHHKYYLRHLKTGLYVQANIGEKVYCTKKRPNNSTSFEEVSDAEQST